MYLEAVTVCVDYSDILALTIPYNKSVIDNWVIVTSTADNLTKCQNYLKCKCKRSRLHLTHAKAMSEFYAPFYKKWIKVLEWLCMQL